ncbi:alpha/beta hydrolase [Staphylococcus gallinarum]|uniref:alpha/beta hydrolase n=1 Tax=Staphylococcus gallinarum TaxID=1293 RepID=UPI000D1E735D|nr:alpha/beta hydrolase [Staphylococcus gallinarum]MCD8787539.1 alpha/beta hydrolase [Staphylococcus gallinarum]MCD8857617.1 alpha/beta hydrolase [Staphylococcus gallinarum]PTL17947.1 alpha/beta hydrolase [Staphylococcus gallinarum]RIO80311.1 alpha/beta hydrolase [Staphylococcus gallinarum]
MILQKNSVFRRMIISSIIVIFTIMSLLYLMTVHNQVNAAQQATTQEAKQTPEPTFYLHGYSGSEKSERYLVNSAIEKGVTNQVIKAHVSADGEVTFDGKFDKNDPHPIVQIILEDNKNWDYNKNAEWFKNVITETEQHIKYSKFNMVAHSMGNLTLGYYMLNYAGDESLPKLNKQVNTGAPYNGILGRNDEPNEVKLDENGKPDQMKQEYKDLQQMKYNYPKKSVDVLNVYGDLQDGSHSDGKVTNQSSLSLKSLLNGYVNSYRTFKVEGEHGEHSALHDYKVVADEINAFIWNK